MLVGATVGQAVALVSRPAIRMGAAIEAKPAVGRRARPGEPDRIRRVRGVGVLPDQ